MPSESTMSQILTILGAFVPLASALASFVNHRVRKGLDAGETPNKALLAVGSMLNVASVNVDKAVQLAKMFGAVGGAAAGTVAPADAAAAPSNAAPAVCPTCGK